MSAIRLLQAGRQGDIQHLHRQLMSGGILQKELWEEAESFLIKKEIYYARHTKTAPFIKTASIILFVIISLITAGYVSAAITGFNPWNFIISINKDEGYIKIKKIYATKKQLLVNSKKENISFCQISRKDLK